MAVDPDLHKRLQTKLDIGRRQVDNLINATANRYFLPRELAAIVLAQERGVSVHSFATADQLATVRGAVSAQLQNESTGQPSSPSAHTTPRSRSAKPDTPGRKRRGKKVFVVHGRDEILRKSLFGFLRSVGLQPIEWNKAMKATGSASPYIGQILDAAFRDAVAVIVLLTGDDEARLRESLRKRTDPPYEGELTPQARPNVLFEAGMAFGHRPEATVLVQVGPVRPFSDVGGRHVVHLDNTPEKRTELVTKLRTAGCTVDLDGSDWLSEGDFEFRL